MLMYQLSIVGHSLSYLIDKNAEFRFRVNVTSKVFRAYVKTSAQLVGAYLDILSFLKKCTVYTFIHFLLIKFITLSF